MGRGRSCVVYQGDHDIIKRKHGHVYFFASKDCSDKKRKKVPPTAPCALVDKLRQLDPQVLASLLLK